MSTLRNKTLFITGASRGIGKAIALRAAVDGANVVVAAKSAVPHPQLPGTIHSAAEEIEAAGGRALAVRMDVRHEDQVLAAVAAAVERFGGIDILVNNASAIWLAGTADTPMRRFDLMFSVNVRGTFLCSQAVLPWLEKSDNAHILNLAPPPDLDARWLKDHCAYTISKYGMSLCALGMAAELAPRGIAVNALWPVTVIDTAALRMLGDRIDRSRCRVPGIMADAAHAILVRDARTTTGRFFLDEEALAEAGVTDLARYAVDPARPLIKDLFVD